MKLKVIELFGGIGACTKALKRLGVDVEVVDYVEIDKHAVASYNAINGTNFEPQDVSKWDKGALRRKKPGVSWDSMMKTLRKQQRSHQKTNYINKPAIASWSMSWKLS